MERTFDNLRKTLKGKIYLYLKDAETERQFIEDAQAEGYRFGSISPADSLADNIISLCEDKQLSHVGAIGRIAFQCNGGSGARGRFHRIDYAIFRRGDNNYYYVPDDPFAKIKTQNPHITGM